ncbi:hypothetical protein JCM30760_18800 [Thiomicrorhabdus hydrogeniphila]
MQRTITLPIKGTFYYSAYDAMQEGLLTKNTILSLKPEPDNGFDKNAMQIWLPVNSDKTYDKTHANQLGLLLGYVPKSLSAKISHLYSHHLISEIHIVHYAQLGKRIEIDYQILINQAWLPYVWLFIQSKIIAKIYSLKRTKERLFGHHS